MFDVDEIGLGMETVTMKAIDDYMELLLVMEVEMVLVLVMEIMMEIVMVLVMVMEVEIMMEMTRR